VDSKQKTLRGPCEHGTERETEPECLKTEKRNIASDDM